MEPVNIERHLAGTAMQAITPTQLHTRKLLGPKQNNRGGEWRKTLLVFVWTAMTQEVLAYLAMSANLSNTQN